MHATIHHFNTAVAKEYGMPCAVIFEWMVHWVEYNKANDTNFHDGKHWVFNSYKSLEELFPYIGHNQMKAALKKLVDANMLVKGCYNNVSFDRTLWYTIGSEGLKYASHLGGNSANALDENHPFSLDENHPFSLDENHPTNTNIETIREKSNRKGVTKAEKHTKIAFGEMENVYLTAEEYAGLLVKMGDIGRQKYIDAVSLYKASKGKEYKSDYSACLQFWIKDGRPVENTAVIVPIHIEKPDLSTPEKIREAIFT
jgi:hypothetical protein